MDISVNNIMLSSCRNLSSNRFELLFEQMLGDLMSLFSDAASKTNSSAVSIGELRDVKLSVEGDSDAYRRIIDRHQQHISRIMFRFSRDRQVHAELVQDVFVEAYLGLKTYKAKAPLEHWIARIATRVGYSYWKQQEKQKKTETFSIEDWDRIEQSTESNDPSEAAEILYKLFAELSSRDRLVLTLRFLEQCSIEETARRTGWSESMVKVQTHRAKNQLKKLFRKVGKDMEL